jgi:DNA-binding transcriptional ArsR family regulator
VKLEAKRILIIGGGSGIGLELARRLDQVLSRLGDPTRLSILRLLDSEGELAAGELVERLAMPQATVSTHLACLRWCGFVTTRRADRSVIYRLADPRVKRAHRRGGIAVGRQRRARRLLPNHLSWRSP